MKKKQPTTKKKAPSSIKVRRLKGGVDAGTVYGVILLSIIVGGGYLMLGDIAPKLASPDAQQGVSILGPKDKSSHSDLQLKTFNGITPNATETPTPTPSPTPTTPPPAPDGGSDGGGSCFIKGTKVLMADKTQKNIEEVKAGDKVMGYDGEHQAVETVRKMESPIREDYYNIKLADGTIVGVTDEHPLYTEKGWESISPEHTVDDNPDLHVGKLNVGDKVLKSSGHYITVVSMTDVPGKVQVYNLKSVSGYNDFYANGILAHNKGSDGGDGGSDGGGAPAADGSM